MAKPKNEAIGECPCPARGCDLTAQVFKFKGRADVSKQWLAGKMYLSCAQHGRFGSDGRQAMQEYILENSQIWDEKEKSERAAHVAAPAKNSAPEAVYILTGDGTGADTIGDAKNVEISGPVGHVAVEVDRPALLAEAAAIAADAPDDAAPSESPTAGSAEPAVSAPEVEAAGMQPVMRLACAQLAALAPGWRITTQESDTVADAASLVMAYWVPPGIVQPKYVALMSLAGALWSVAAQRRVDGKFLPLRNPPPERKPAAQTAAAAPANQLAL